MVVFDIMDFAVIIVVIIVTRAVDVAHSGLVAML